jgi:hypothetical protein
MPAFARQDFRRTAQFVGAIGREELFDRRAACLGTQIALRSQLPVGPHRQQMRPVVEIRA